MADTHVGFELELWRQGVKVPFQTDSMAQKILRLARENGCDTVVFNGDLKHEIAVYRGRQEKELERFMATLQEQVDLVFVQGNHDGGLRGEPHLQLGKFFVFHGHAYPPEEALGKIWITAHVHPHISFKDDFGKLVSLPVWIKGESRSAGERYGRRVSTRIVVMPAFNTLRSGFSINTGEGKKGLLSLLDSYAVVLLDGVEVLKTDRLKATHG